MTKKKKNIIGAVGTCIMLLIVGCSAVYYILTKSLPQTEGSLRVRGLSAEVLVYRDEIGVPHVVAQNEYDLYFAAGFVTAQDRLWQMDMMRRYGEGKLSEVLGSSTITIDKLMKTIGFSLIADSLLGTISQQSKNILDAYAKGVNACIEEMKNKYPVEFDILRYTPEPWTPKHSLLVTRLMGWELALSWWVDLTLGDLVQKVGEEKAREVFPFDDPAMPSIVESRVHSPQADELSKLFCEQNKLARSLFGQEGSAIGSNSWAVTRTKSITGFPILANDPHLEHMQPARFYIIHLSAPGINVAGVSIPATPGVIIGHNDQIAWGLTNVMADDVDFYVEHIDEHDSTYEYKGKQLPFSVRVDTIFVKDTLPIPFAVRSTLHGPIVSQSKAYHVTSSFPKDRSGIASPHTEAMAMRWSGYESSDEILSLYKINHARGWIDFRNALKTFGAPGQNFIYADRMGNIGYVCAAKLPIRSARCAMLPNAGWKGEGEWQGFIPFEKLPGEYNPPENLVATANNRTTKDFPYHISNLWEGDSRIRRILEMLHDQRIFTYNDFRLMQMDLQSPYARQLKGYFIDALRRDSTRTPEMTKMMNLLTDWDCRMYTSSVPATIFNVAFQHLINNTFHDEMGEDLYNRYIYISNLPTRVIPHLLADTATQWFDNVLTPNIESRDDIIRQSMIQTYEQLKAELGSNRNDPADMNEWRWGKIHRVTFRHVLGAIKPLEKFFNVGPYELGGNTTTVNSGEFSYRLPYETRVGPAMRMIVNLASLDTCSIVLATGQSGQPLSRYYANQTVFWQNGAYHPLISNVATIQNLNWEKLVLHP